MSRFRRPAPLVLVLSASLAAATGPAGAQEPSSEKKAAPQAATPAATPKDILARLSTEMVKIIQSPEFRKRMDEIGAEPIGNTPDQMARQIKDETEKFSVLVRDAKVTIE